MSKVAHIVNKFKNLLGNNKKTVDDNAYKNPEFLETLTYKTPFFLFNRNKIIHNYEQFKKLFPHSSVYFAIKANSEPEVLKTILDTGCGFEIASKYELDYLKKIKVPAERIVYGTSVKPADHIKEVFEYGVDKFAFDSFSELDKLAAQAPGSKVYVRTIANDSGSVFKFSEKFGTDAASIIPLLTKAKELGLVPYGISFHVGSQASDPKAWANVILSLRSIIQDLKELGIKLEVLNIGGGFPCDYATGPVPSLKEIAKQTLMQYKKLPYEPKIILEPGRGLIADTGIAVATVIAKVERRGNTWLFLDLGVYNGLFETMAYQGSTRYPISSMRPVGDAGEALFELAGPTGDSPDVVTREALLPKDIEVGDKVIIHNVGAYSLTVTSNFNGFPKPEVYFL
jgi:ornithine decarboxylase